MKPPISVSLLMILLSAGAAQAADRGDRIDNRLDRRWDCRY